MPEFRSRGKGSKKRIYPIQVAKNLKQGTAFRSKSGSINKRSLERLFELEEPITVRHTSGWKYSKISYDIVTPTHRITVFKRTYTDGKYDWNIHVYALAKGVKEDTPEYKELLKKYGHLSIIKVQIPDGYEEKVYTPVIVDDWYNTEAQILKKLEPFEVGVK